MTINRSNRSFLVHLQRFPLLLDLIRRVWRFTRPKYTAGSVAVIFNDAGEVLLVEHIFHAFTPWGLPGGYVDRREDPDRALIRELREELELDAEALRVIAVERIYGNHLDFAYLCAARGVVGKLSFELNAYRWTNLDELPELTAFQQRAILDAAAWVQQFVK